MKQGITSILGHVLKWREKEIESLAEGSAGPTELSRLKLANVLIVHQGKFLSDIIKALKPNTKLNLSILTSIKSAKNYCKLVRY